MDMWIYLTGRAASPKFPGQKNLCYANHTIPFGVTISYFNMSHKILNTENIKNGRNTTNNYRHDHQINKKKPSRIYKKTM